MPSSHANDLASDFGPEVVTPARMSHQILADLLPVAFLASLHTGEYGAPDFCANPKVVKAGGQSPILAGFAGLQVIAIKSIGACSSAVRAGDS